MAEYADIPDGFKIANFSDVPKGFAVSPPDVSPDAQGFDEAHPYAAPALGFLDRYVGQPVRQAIEGVGQAAKDIPREIATPIEVKPGENSGLVRANESVKRVGRLAKDLGAIAFSPFSVATAPINPIVEPIAAGAGNILKIVAGGDVANVPEQPLLQPSHATSITGAAPVNPVEGFKQAAQMLAMPGAYSTGNENLDPMLEEAGAIIPFVLADMAGRNLAPRAEVSAKGEVPVEVKPPAPKAEVPQGYFDIPEGFKPAEAATAEPAPIPSAINELPPKAPQAPASETPAPAAARPGPILSQETAPLARPEQPAIAPAPKEVVPIIRTPETGPPSRANVVQDFINKRLRMRLRDEIGQQRFEALQEENAPVKPIMDEFWDKTFPAMNAEGQKMFLREVKAQLGLAPGDVLSVNTKTGERTVAQSWRDVTDFPGKYAGDLEQNEGAVTTLADIMNEIRRKGNYAAATPLPELPAPVERRTAPRPATEMKQIEDATYGTLRKNGVTPPEHPSIAIGARVNDGGKLGTVVEAGMQRSPGETVKVKYDDGSVETAPVEALAPLPEVPKTAPRNKVIIEDENASAFGWAREAGMEGELRKAAYGSETGGPDVVKDANGQWHFVESPRETAAPPTPAAEPRVVPGARSAFTGSEAGTDIAQLSRSLANKAKDANPNVVMDAARQVGDQAAKFAESAYAQLGEAKAKAFGATAKVKVMSQGLWEKFKSEPKVNDFERAKGQWQGAIQKNDWELQEFSKNMKAAYPDKARREAMSVYAEAGGDLGKLQAWEKDSIPANAQKYKLAQTLTDDERVFAQNARNYWDAKLDQAIEAGILDHGVEEYVTHLVKKQNKLTNQLQARIAVDKLQTNPAFAKQRVHDTIFDLEQAGHSADTDLGLMMAAYDQAFSRAVASRAYIKSLLEGKAADGRPIAHPAGVGMPLPKDAKVAESFLIRPKAKGDFPDYQTVDHPALRKWKWAASDSGGKPIYVQGDLLIHPDHAAEIRNNLGKSWFRKNAGNLEWARVPLKAAMDAGQVVKGTMLDLSGFHQSQVTVHGLEHRVNPFRLENIDIENPKQSKLIDWGLQVADYRAQAAFSEGSTSGSMVRKIPILGKYAQMYNEYLFRDYIPRMKMTMALHALERNTQRYAGKLSEDQIYRRTAEQANAAFGELNYKMMGRNPTFQDVLRLSLLAPDFLEARGRFSLQAFKKGGAEQLTALGGGAVVLYTFARIANQAISGNPHWDRPFSVIGADNKEYRLRTVQGDWEHLIRDPRQFLWVRFNPTTTKPAFELISGRDEWGRKRSRLELTKDLGKQIVPIIFQKRVRNPEEYSLLDSALQAVGISNTKYRSNAERLARDYAAESVPPSESEEAKQHARKVRKAVADYKAGRTRLDILAKTGEYSQRDLQRIPKEAHEPELVRDFSGLPIEKALEVWDETTPEEKKLLRRYLVAKGASIQNHPPQQAKALTLRLRVALAQK